MLLIEQNVTRALAVAGRAYVMENGHIVTEGVSAELASQPNIRQAYLGETG